MGTKISYKGNQVGSGNSSGAETIVDKTSLPSSGIENVIYRVTDSVSRETSYHAGNETEAETEQLAKYSDIQIIQVETIPSAGASHLGKIYQYIGATNLSYTNGYFYKCVSDGESTPSYSWEEVQVQKIDDITPHWTGTQAEYTVAASGIEDGTIVNITDDYQEGVEVVDVVEEDNEGVPTSAAVYEALHPTGTYSNWTFLWTHSNNGQYVDKDGDEQGFLLGRIRNDMAEFFVYNDETSRTISLPIDFKPSNSSPIAVMSSLSGPLLIYSDPTTYNGSVKLGSFFYLRNSNTLTIYNYNGSYDLLYFSYPLN